MGRDTKNTKIQIIRFGNMTRKELLKYLRRHPHADVDDIEVTSEYSSSDQSGDDDDSKKRKWESVDYDEVAFLGTGKSDYGTDQRKIKKMKVTHAKGNDYERGNYSFPRHTTEDTWDWVFPYKMTNDFVDDLIQNAQEKLDRYKKWKNNINKK